MKLGSLAAARPIPSDRNPTYTQSIFGVLPSAPHAQTNRWSFTVATGKSAQILAAQIFVQRASAAAALSYVTMDITSDVSGAGNSIIYCALRDNTVGSTQQTVLSASAIFAAGTILISRTQDLCTGGTVDFVTSCLFMSFDR